MKTAGWIDCGNACEAAGTGHTAANSPSGLTITEHTEQSIGTMVPFESNASYELMSQYVSASECAACQMFWGKSKTGKIQLPPLMVPLIRSQ